MHGHHHKAAGQLLAFVFQGLVPQDEEGAQHHAGQPCDQGDQQRVPGGCQQDIVLGQLLIPLQGKGKGQRIVSGLVKAHHHQHEDGDIQIQQGQQHKGFASKILFHTSYRLPHLLMAIMLSRTMASSRNAMAAPKFQPYSSVN